MWISCVTLLKNKKLHSDSHSQILSQNRSLLRVTRLTDVLHTGPARQTQSRQQILCCQSSPEEGHPEEEGGRSSEIRPRVTLVLSSEVRGQGNMEIRERDQVCGVFFEII